MIASGHSHRDILDYTVTQFRAYLDRAVNRQRSERRDRIITNYLGFKGGDEMSKALDELKD